MRPDQERDIPYIGDYQPVSSSQRFYLSTHLSQPCYQSEYYQMGPECLGQSSWTHYGGAIKKTRRYFMVRPLTPCYERILQIMSAGSSDQSQASVLTRGPIRAGESGARASLLAIRHLMDHR